MRIKNLPFDNSSSLKDIDISNDESLFEKLDDEDEIFTLEEEEKRNILENETTDPEMSNDYYEFKLCRKKNIRMNKSLFNFRTTQFMWYGGGILPSLYFGIFFKQRGLTVIEISSIFSVIFIFQLIAAFITGIIADKLGNAKPVLMFLMLSTFFFLVTLLLTPNVNKISCKMLEKNLNESELSELRKEFRSCFTDCIFKDKNNTSHKENYNENSKVLNSSSVVEGLDLEIADRNSICDFFGIQATNISLYASKDDCCESCVSSTKVDCMKVRNGYLVALYAIIIIAFYSVYSTTYRFTNLSAISLAEKTDSDFGKELAVARSADLLVIIIVAFVLNSDKASGSGINFNSIFWIAASIMLSAILTLFATKVPILPTSKDLMKTAFKLIRNADTLAFILIIFVSGNGHSFYFTFHFVFLETMNASSIVVALHSVTVILYSFPFLLKSKWWLEKTGVNQMLVLGLLFRGINFISFSYMSNPWWILVTDVCLVFSDELFWVAVIKHCWIVAPVGFAATFVASTGTMHFGIGRSSGVFFGGMMINYLGLRMTYRILAAICFVTAFSYSIFVYKRRKSPVHSHSHLDNEW